jgi:PNKP adenylyltransferase domain, C-terminal region
MPIDCANSVTLVKRRDRRDAPPADRCPAPGRGDNARFQIFPLASVKPECAAIGFRPLTRVRSRQPLRCIHECIFGILALKSEPVGAGFKSNTLLLETKREPAGRRSAARSRGLLPEDGTPLLNRVMRLMLSREFQRPVEPDLYFAARDLLLERRQIGRLRGQGGQLFLESASTSFASRRRRAQMSPVGTIAAVSTIKMMLFSGARVQCITPFGTTKP